MDEDIDKTGYTKIKAEALLKALKFCTKITEVTIGPDACPSNIEAEDDSKDDSPPPKTLYSRKTQIVDSNFIDSSVIIDKDEERLCAKKLLAELNNFCIIDGQRMKFSKMKKHLEELERAKYDADRIIAAMDNLAVTRRQEIEEKVNLIQKQLIVKQQEIASSESFHNRLEELKRQEEELDKQMKDKSTERKKLYDSVYKDEMKFKNFYSEILDIIKNNTQKKLFLQVIMSDVELARKINGKFISLIERCKGGAIKSADAVISSSLLRDISTINSKIKIEKEKYDAKERETKEQEFKFQQIEKNEKIINFPETKVVPETDKQEKKVSPCNYREKHKSLMEYLAEVEQKLKPFISDESFKKYRSDCQKAVNLPVNAISPCSATHLTDKLKKLTTLLQGQYVSVADARVSANNHPLGVIYCTNLLAQKIVKQGEQVVSSKPDAAYAIAAVTVAVWMEFPDFGKLLLAHFYRRCPYLVPIYWEKEDDQTDEEYNKKLGFNYSNGEIEELNMFLKRQGGIVKLYSSIMITDKKKALQMYPHPYDIREGWELLVAFVKLEPKPEISPTVLFDVLEVVGYAMLKTFGIQFRKLLHVICKSYLPKVVEVTTEGMSGGPISRLKNFLESLAEGKELQPPKGLLPANFW